MIGRTAFALALLAAPLAAAPAAADVALDGFMAGMTDACTMNQDFEAFFRSLADRYGSTGHAGARVAIPDAVAPAIGKARSKNLGEYTEVVVPLSGTYAGLPVDAYVFRLGNENGIVRWEVRFAADAATVHARLDAKVAASLKKLRKIDEADIGFSTGLETSDGRVALWCDMST